MTVERERRGKGKEEEGRTETIPFHLYLGRVVHVLPPPRCTFLERMNTAPPSLFSLGPLLLCPLVGTDERMKGKERRREGGKEEGNAE